MTSHINSSKTKGRENYYWRNYEFSIEENLFVNPKSLEEFFAIINCMEQSNLRDFVPERDTSIRL